MGNFGAALVGGILLLAAVPAAAASGDMSVAAFLDKTEALKRRGPLALLSSDVGVLKREVTASAAAYRARIASDEAARRAAHSCPPQRAGMSSDDLIAHLQDYPAARRTQITVRQAFFDLMKKRYPCS